MNRNAIKVILVLFLSLISFFRAEGQLSPGALSNAHSNLEGMSNCTQCHVLGNKVSNEKCLVCHVEIKSRTDINKGYHSSTDVKGKQCFECHSEHNGKNFQIIRFDTTKFDHNNTGYSLSIPHAKQECKVCHNPKYITDQKLKEKKSTFLGLKTECLTCHADYHLRTLSSSCLNCHKEDSFVPASKFNHDNAKFKLAGKHKSVVCAKCHKVETVEGKKFQQFRGIQYSNCTSCHKDPHSNQFGQNCRQCHSEESFKAVSGMNNFDHNKTAFKLEEKHLIVKCNDCHKTKFTDPLKHDRCTDCHSDYHNKQFVKNGVAPDCSECHTVKGFTLFNYSVENHNLNRFPLEGSHAAIPCYECHKKQEKWSFREIGLNCRDCHTDIHKTYISAKYYPEASCISCHNTNRWTSVSFDHSKTDFKLTGAHAGKDCRSCHYKKDVNGAINQRFAGLPKDCSACHTDNHFNQFEKNGITDCNACHTTANWKAPLFNHDNTAFKLDGKHVNVACAKCHKPQQEGSKIYVKYKLKEFKCESCHL
ncbi:MAG: cytochrome C [Bacteroidales bacterium]|nr:cytochrome C [Bacteroidales bacterium]